MFRTDTFCTDDDMIDYDSNEEMTGFQLNQIQELEEKESDHSSAHHKLSIDLASVDLSPMGLRADTQLKFGSQVDESSPASRRQSRPDKVKYLNSTFKKQTEMLLSGKLSSRNVLLRKKTQMQSTKDNPSDLQIK